MAVPMNPYYQEQGPEFEYRQDVISKCTSIIDNCVYQANEARYQDMSLEEIKLEANKSERVEVAYVHDGSNYWQLKKELKNQNSKYSAATYYSMELLNPNMNTIQIKYQFDRHNGGYIVDGLVPGYAKEQGKLVRNPKELEHQLNLLQKATLVSQTEGEEVWKEFSTARAAAYAERFSGGERGSDQKEKSLLRKVGRKAQELMGMVGIEDDLTGKE